jgi:hypothetical protein
VALPEIPKIIFRKSLQFAAAAASAAATISASPSIQQSWLKWPSNYARKKFILPQTAPGLPNVFASTDNWPGGNGLITKPPIHMLIDNYYFAHLTL